jgi:Type II secretory pathway, pseudopilin PulG
MRRSGLFLIEIVIVILFFAVSAAVCMRIFAAAKITSDRAQKLDNAVQIAQNAAEFYKNSGGDLDVTATKLGAKVEDGSVTLVLDGGLTLALVPDNAKSDEDASFCDVSVLNADGDTVFAVTAAVLGD